MTNNDDGGELSFEKTEALLESIETPEDLFGFLEMFEREISQNREYRGLLFSDGVGGLATYLYKNPKLPEQPDWKTVADILFRGMYHA